MRVKEIGFTVGMSDQSHFVRDFRQGYGAMPSEYLRQHWAKIEVKESNSNKS